ncbi:MAG: aminomethyltransferase, partial [Pseudomonadota bacterium]
MLDTPDPSSEYPDVPPGPPSPSVIHNRIRPVLPRGVERYIIEGRRSALFQIRAGDTITVTDREGGQPCELLAADTKGVIDPGMLGRKGNSKATGIKTALAGNTESAKQARRALARRKIDLADARAIRLFSQTSRPGNTTTLTAERAGIVLVCAPGADMMPDTQSTTTEIEVLIRRAKVAGKTAAPPLPEPLAKPLNEIRIASSTAEAYTVRA